MTNVPTKKEIVLYVLAEVLELSNDSVESLIKNNGYDTIRKVASVTDKSLERLVESEVINTSDYDQMLTFRDWYICQRTPPNLLPSSVDQWKEALTAEILDNFKFASPAKSNDSITENKSDPKPSTPVKLADYPVFNGTLNAWKIFKQTFQATADLAPLAD